MSLLVEVVSMPPQSLPIVYGSPRILESHGIISLVLITRVTMRYQFQTMDLEFLSVASMLRLLRISEAPGL